jgi:uracil-DNA glycosylase
MCQSVICSDIKDRDLSQLHWLNQHSDLWSKTGFSKEVNRAASLRNWLKMMLVARGDLQEDYSQAAIAAIDKSQYWQTAERFFTLLGNVPEVFLNTI